MIAYIKGQLTQKTPAYVIIETSGGVAYHINISLNTYSQMGTATNCKLFTFLHIKDDAHTLYGFAEEDERALFKQLISVSGIGPATAQVMLSSLNPAEVRQAIMSENVNQIKSVKGIGPKTAKRVILELKDKIAKGSSAVPMSDMVNSQQQHRAEALNALIALGIGKPLAQKAINRIIRDPKKQIKSVEELIKEALKTL